MGTALILVDFQADNIEQDDKPLRALKRLGDVDVIIASRRYTLTEGKCKKDTKGARLASAVTKRASVIVTKDGIGPSAFEGGTLRPIVSTERILKQADVEEVVVGGYFLEWAVAQTAYDASALGYQTTVDLSLTACENSTDEFKINEHFERLARAGIKVTLARL